MDLVHMELVIFGRSVLDIQSSTAPCVVMIPGGLSASNSTGVAPSTVMKKFVGLFGSFGFDSTSEK
jgi:hypothetical protein